MALVNCSECGIEVSEKAWDCGSCGNTLRVPRRGVFGQLIKWTFILFNILMTWWIFAGMSAATSGIDALSSAEKAGAAVGTGLGAMFIIFIWVLGDIILGLFVLFTRPQKK